MASCRRNARCAVAKCPAPLNEPYFRFPGQPKSTCDVEHLQKWLEATQRPNEVDIKGEKVCGVHFTAEDFARDLRNELMNLPARKMLKSDAVPSLYLNEPIPLVQMEKSHLRPKRTIACKSSAVPAEQPTTEEQRHASVTDAEGLHSSQVVLSPFDHAHIGQQIIVLTEDVSLEDAVIGFATSSKADSVPVSTNSNAKRRKVDSGLKRKMKKKQVGPHDHREDAKTRLLRRILNGANKMSGCVSETDSEDSHMSTLDEIELPKSKRKQQKYAKAFELLQMMVVELEHTNACLKMENLVRRKKIDLLLDALVEHHKAGGLSAATVQSVMQIQAERVQQFIAYHKSANECSLEVEIGEGDEEDEDAEQRVRHDDGENEVEEEEEEEEVASAVREVVDEGDLVEVEDEEEDDDDDDEYDDDVDDDDDEEEDDDDDVDDDDDEVDEEEDEEEDEDDAQDLSAELVVAQGAGDLIEQETQVVTEDVLEDGQNIITIANLVSAEDSNFIMVQVHNDGATDVLQ